MYFVWFFSKLDNMYHRVLPGRSLEGCRELIDDLKRLYDCNFIIQPYQFFIMEVNVDRDSKFNTFELEVIGGQNNEKNITIKCNTALKCVVCGHEITAYPGSVISFSVQINALRFSGAPRVRSENFENATDLGAKSLVYD